MCELHANSISVSDLYIAKQKDRMNNWNSFLVYDPIALINTNTLPAE